MLAAWVPGARRAPRGDYGDAVYAHRQEQWEQLKDDARSLSILDVARRLGLGEPVKQGKEYVVSCPMHDDRKPSLQLNPAKGTWYCFPCGIGGDGIGLVMKARRVGFPEAIRELTA